MITRTVLFFLVLIQCIPAFAQKLRSVEGIRISQIDGNIQLDSLVAFSETYDSSGILTFRTDMVEQPNTYYLEKAYNSRLQIIREEKKSLEGSSIEIIEYQYNVEGEMLQRITLHPGGDTLVQGVRNIIGVDNLLVKTVFSTAFTSDEAPVIDQKFFSYDQKNRVSHIYYLKNKHKTMEEFYVYDSDGDLVEESFTFLNPAYNFKKTYKYKKGYLVQHKEYIDEKLVSINDYNRNDLGEITFVETSFPDKNGVQTTYYQRKYWPPEAAPAEISRGEDTQTAEKP